MGYNISGLAINKNYKNDFEQLQKELGWNLEKESEIDFEAASANWTDEGICTVYFSEKGTLIFLNMDMCADSFKIKNANTLTFALSETVMAFNLNYCENAVEKRTIMEVDGVRMEDEGEKLSIEAETEDTSELIWNQIEIVLGKSFFEIDLEEKAMRYSFKNAKLEQVEIPIEAIKVENSETNQKPALTVVNVDQQVATESKKWWEFWR